MLYKVTAFDPNQEMILSLFINKGALVIEGGGALLVQGKTEWDMVRGWRGIN